MDIKQTVVIPGLDLISIEKCISVKNIAACTEPYQSRVLVEAVELKDRTMDLAKFLGTDHGLPKDVENVLKYQLNTMSTYLRILQFRLDGFK